MNTNLTKSQVLAITTTSAVLTSLVSVFGYHVYQQYQFNGEAPMKWSWLPYLGFALDMGAKPIQLFKSLANEFGEIFGIITLGNRMFIITDPHSYHLVINANPKILSVQEFFYQVESNFFGVRNHINEKNHHIVRIGYSKHLFADSGLVRLTDRMQSYLQQSIREIKSGTFAMQDFLSRQIFRASISALFNDDVANDERLFRAFVEFDKALPLACAGVHVKHFATPWQGRNLLMDACNHNRNGLSDFIIYRWKLFAQWLEDGWMSPDDAAAYQVGMLWASVGNTMPTVFWLLYYILSNPLIHTRVKEEIQTACASVGVAESIPLSKLNEMVLLNACITETLRLTSGSLIMRIVKEPHTITLASGVSYRFRAGDRVGLCPPLAHLDEEMFPNAMNFVPDRWLVGSNIEELIESSQGKIFLSKGGKEVPVSLAYLPFGGGASLCPGRKFARNEIKTLIVYLLQLFDFSLDSNIRPEFDGSRCGLGIFPPKQDIPVTVTAKFSL